MLTVLLRTIQPLILISGYYLFYAYITRDTEQNMWLYYAYILLVSITDIPRMGFEIQRDIQNEQYLMIDRLPIHPFLYYLLSNIGKNAPTIIACTLVAIVLFTLQKITAILAISIFFAALTSILLTHMIVFCIAILVFYYEQMHMWLVSIVFEFAGGKLIPFTVLPLGLNIIFTWVLPFGYAGGTFAQFVSRGQAANIWLGLVIGAVWITGLLKLTGQLWKKGSFYFQEHN